LDGSESTAARPETDLRTVGVVNVLPSTEARERGLRSTHPPTEERIERLRDLTVDAGT
jgi:Zn-dependent protease with chaperone function